MTTPAKELCGPATFATCVVMSVTQMAGRGSAERRGHHRSQDQARMGSAW